jgi:hypothetical protein
MAIRQNQSSSQSKIHRAMTLNRSSRHFYHVGPWRRALPWLIFGPFLLLALGACVFGKTAEDRSAGGILIAILTPIAFGTHALISYARLELNAEGVRLRQIGMNMSAPWSNIAGLRLERRREGFVTHNPMTGAGAGRLAALRGYGYAGAAMYNEEQQAAMAERRWIPIEAFAWHIRRGRLRQHLESLAPAVQAIESTLEPVEGTAATPESSTGKTSAGRWWLIGLICALSLGVAAVVSFELVPQLWTERIFALLLSLIAPLAVLRAGWSTRNAFRERSYFVGAMFVLLTLLAMLWSILCWGSAVDVFSR